MESAIGFRELFKSFKSKNIEFREKKFYIDQDDKINYTFNSSINSIEESDLILLIGSNPRHEATMINARIKKTYNKNKIPILSIGDPGDLTYNYEIIGEDTQVIKDIIENKNEVTKKILNAKKPLVILGESALEGEKGKYIFEEIKNFLFRNNFINEKWNALNILLQNASSAGILDLKLIKYNENNNFEFFNKLENRKFKFLYLLGSDNLEIKKNNEFIVYHGSHGDKGAEIADVILPSAAFTEQNGLYTNLEGRVQECRKASYPPGQAKEDLKIFSLILKELNQNNTIINQEKIRKDILNIIPNFSKINDLPKRIINKHNKKNTQFVKEKIKISKIDYYYTNAIARASKTMSECKKIKNQNLKNGTLN